MQVREILHKKGSHVFSVHPDDAVGTVLNELVARKIGSAVVVDRWGKLAGIVSERDIVQGISRHGAGVLASPVKDIMLTPATTCTPDDEITGIMSVMTLRRVRHLPVVAGDKLCGVVSIGDVVKHRLDEIQLEVNVLRDYARTTVR
jgi:CBS domain-containing protein